MFKQNDLLIVITYIIAFLSVTVTVIIVFILKSRKKIYDKEVEKKDLELQFQKELMQSSIHTQENERERIAQELHDDINSKLNIVVLKAQLLKSSSLTKKESKEFINYVINDLTKVIDRSRKMAHELLPPVLNKFGLNVAIEELIYDYENIKTITFKYENELDFKETDIKKQLYIFRILQELINNSMKHGNSSKITIKFCFVENKKTCIYTDNGIGFNMTTTLSKGLGFSNIINRVLFLNGKYTMFSEEKKGFRFCFNFE